MAVVFDLDGTVCVDDQEPARMLAAAFDRVGADAFCDAGAFVSTWTDVGTVDSDVEFYREQFRIAASRADGNAPDPDDPVLWDLARAYDDERDHTRVSFVPGAETALTAAAESPRPVALVTNGGRGTQTTKLESLGIGDLFDARVFAEPGGAVKPEPEPFEAALEELDVEATAAMAVGDRLEADVAGANALGMESVWYRGNPERSAPAGGPEPDHTVDAMEELMALI